MNIQLILTTLVALLSATVLLVYLDASTLFLAALLLAIVTTKLTKRVDVAQQISGLWFALSVAPASKVPLDEITTFSNGFVVMSLLSLVFFLYFYTQKPSIIGRLEHSEKYSAGKIVSSAIAGFAAGILSAVLWQGYLKLAAL